jgi:predicted dehydrogenase
VRVLSTVAALLDDRAVELVVVAVQNAAHYDVARTALEAAGTSSSTSPSP